MMTTKAAAEVLVRYAEYGNLIGKVMSESESLPWQMPQGGRVQDWPGEPAHCGRGCGRGLTFPGKQPY